MYYLNSINFILHIKGQNLDSYFEKFSSHHIKIFKLRLTWVKPSHFEVFIPNLLKLPNLKANLEELKIESQNFAYIDNFIESWNECNQFENLKKVKFI